MCIELPNAGGVGGGPLVGKLTRSILDMSITVDLPRSRSHDPSPLVGKFTSVSSNLLSWP
jgi:hypothetical protein